MKYKELTAEDGMLLGTDEVSLDNGKSWSLASKSNCSYTGLPIARWLAPVTLDGHSYDEYPQGLRARRPIVEEELRWILSSELTPTESDYPIQTRYLNSRYTNIFTYDRGLNNTLKNQAGSYKWAPYKEPAEPKVITQAEKDRNWVLEYVKDRNITATPTIEGMMLDAIEHGRATAKSNAGFPIPSNGGGSGGAGERYSVIHY